MNSDLIQQAILNKASKDKFILVFDIPAALRGTDSKFNISSTTVARDSIQFSVFGMLVPLIRVPSLVQPYSGQSLKVSTHAREPYEDITLGFNVDNRFKNWWTIWKWLDLMNDAKLSFYDQKNLGNPAFDYLRNYQTDFNILALDEYNKIAMNFTYTKCFPIQLDGINYDYKDPAEISSGFTFSFSQFLAEPP